MFLILIKINKYNYKFNNENTILITFVFWLRKVTFLLFCCLDYSANHLRVLENTLSHGTDVPRAHNIFLAN